MTKEKNKAKVEERSTYEVLRDREEEILNV